MMKPEVVERFELFALYGFIKNSTVTGFVSHYVPHRFRADPAIRQVGYRGLLPDDDLDQVRPEELAKKYIFEKGNSRASVFTGLIHWAP